jgi:predicted ATPase
VLWGACDEELSLPYQPFVEGLRWLAEVTPTDTLRDLIGGTGRRADHGWCPTWPAGARSAAPPQRRPESERYRLFEAVTDVLRNLSAREPVVLVLDDLHWAGRPTLLLLRHLLKTTKRSRC